MFKKLINDVLLDDLSFSCIGSASLLLTLALALTLALVVVLTAGMGRTLTCFITVTSTTCVVALDTVVSLLCSLVVVVVPFVRD